MDSIELSVKMPIFHKIGDKLVTSFYERFEEKYERRQLVATITDVQLTYSVLKSEITVVYVVQSEYEDRVFTTEVTPYFATEVTPYNE